MVQIDQWLASVRSAPEPWIAAAVITVGVLIFSGLMADLFFALLRAGLPRMDKEAHASLRDSFRKPLRLLLTLVGFYAALHRLPLQAGADAQLIRLLKVGIILIVAYGAFNLEGVLAAAFKKLDGRMNLQGSELLRQFFIRVIRFLVAIVAVALVLDQFGIDVGNILAGLGIAGLAVALAAQDTLANILAGIMLILDKPFDVGELVSFENQLGTVENINFRSVRIRLLTQELVVIPNSAIAKGMVTNYSRRSQRRAEVRLGLSQSLSRAVLEPFIQEAEKLLKATEGIDAESVVVKLETVQEEGPVLYLCFLTETADWDEFTAIRQEALFLLMEAQERHRIGTARQRVAVFQGQ